MKRQYGLGRKLLNKSFLLVETIIKLKPDCLIQRLNTPRPFSAFFSDPFQRFETATENLDAAGRLDRPARPHFIGTDSIFESSNLIG